MSVSDAAGPAGLGFVFVGMAIGGATLWIVPALMCVVIGFSLLVLSR